MKFLVLILGLCSMSTTAIAAKDCEQLKNEIDTKIKAKGVASYSLNIVDNDSPMAGKVAGTCGGGTKKIVYVRALSSVNAVETCLSSIQKDLDATYKLEDSNPPPTIKLKSFPACAAPITPELVRSNAKTCYGANNEVCESCDDVVKAYEGKNWHFNPALFVQCSHIE